MHQKVVLILVDGMRPDAVELCYHPFLREFRKECTSCFSTQTVMPSVTLPCHTSLFFGVSPDRHGITTNVWRPMVRPIDSLGDLVKLADKKAAMFYNWEELRDLNRPGSLHYSHFQTEALPHQEALKSEMEMTDLALRYIEKELPDFLFLYLGYTDEAGHHYGWMGEEYLAAVSNASNCIQHLKNNLPDSYSIIITADHGGHLRDHGTDSSEDMTIPVWFYGPDFCPGKILPSLSILDLAPTIADLLCLKKNTEWDGHSILDSATN